MYTGAYLSSYIDILCRRADELMKEAVPELTREAYMVYFETGNRLTYERLYFARREQLTVFGLISALWTDIRYKYDSEEKYLSALSGFAGKLFDVAEAVTAENTWVLPAHGSPEHTDGIRNTIDLFAAETAGSLSEILFIIKDNPAIRYKYQDRYISLCRHFTGRLKKRIFDVFLSKRPCDWWEDAGMNWTSVCAANIGVSAYYVQKLSEDILPPGGYEEIMDRVSDAMVCYLDGMSEDGACSEGCGYYKYGMEYFLKFYELLQAAGDLCRLKKIGGFKEKALFLQRAYLGNGNFINFADCDMKSKMKLGMVSYMSRLYNEISISREWVRDGGLYLDEAVTEVLGGEECHRWLGAYSDYIWVKKYGSNLNAGDCGSSHMFAKQMWYVKRWNENTAFYIKGGNNDESHNHNDIGSFGYIADGEELLCELGAGEYTRDYFGDRRYDILCTGSMGHSVPIVAGRCQRSGAEARADSFCMADGGGIRLSYLNAYCTDSDDAAGGSIVREVIFGAACEGRESFTIRDTFDISRLWGTGTVITEVLVSKTRPAINGNNVTLRGKKTGAVISYEKGTYERLYIEEKLHKEHDGKSIKVFLIKADYINKKAANIIDIKVERV